MPFYNASEMLFNVVEISRDLFSHAIIDEIESDPLFSMSADIRQEAYLLASKEIDSAIERLKVVRNPVSARAYWHTVSNTVRLCVLERSQQFEKQLADCGDAPVWIPVELATGQEAFYYGLKTGYCLNLKDSGWIKPN